jgi:hypothetical protein
MEAECETARIAEDASRRASKIKAARKAAFSRGNETLAMLSAQADAQITTMASAHGWVQHVCAPAHRLHVALTNATRCLALFAAGEFSTSSAMQIVCAWNRSGAPPLRAPPPPEQQLSRPVPCGGGPRRNRPAWQSWRPRRHARRWRRNPARYAPYLHWLRSHAVAWAQCKKPTDLSHPKGGLGVISGADGAAPVPALRG